jgi:hypothetical protein
MFLSATARIYELSILHSSIMRHNKFVRCDLTFSFVVLDSMPSGYGASLGGELCYINNPTLSLKNQRVFTFGALGAS